MNQPKQGLWLMLMMLMSLGLAACSPQRSPDEVVMRYLEARLAGDSVALRGLMCLPMEAEAETLANGFSGLGARLDNPSCLITAHDGERVVVTCRGAIAVDYDGETSRFPLGQYQLVREDDAWRVCGEIAP